MGTKRGQALIELALGLFSLVLVTSALGVFVSYIVRSLKAQNDLRVGVSSHREEVEIPEFAAKYIFGVDHLKIDEAVKMPQTSILR